MASHLISVRHSASPDCEADEILHLFVPPRAVNGQRPLVRDRPHPPLSVGSWDEATPGRPKKSIDGVASGKA
jgi:hypothetical protein